MIVLLVTCHLKLNLHSMRSVVYQYAFVELVKIVHLSFSFWSGCSLRVKGQTWWPNSH